MKYAINRISNTSPDLGSPKKEEDLFAIVGETVTKEGIGGEKAFHMFRDVLAKATVPVSSPASSFLYQQHLRKPRYCSIW